MEGQQPEREPHPRREVAVPPSDSRPSIPAVPLQDSKDFLLLWLLLNEDETEGKGLTPDHLNPLGEASAPTAPKAVTGGEAAVRVRSTELARFTFNDPTTG